MDDASKSARAAAILTLVGFVNIPIIKFSVDWWNTLHQPASVLRMDGPAIHGGHAVAAADPGAGGDRRATVHWRLHLLAADGGPQVQRIDPLKGIGRLFSAPALVELAKVLIVTALLAVVGFWYVYSHLHEFAGLAYEALPSGLAHFGWMLGAAFVLMVATLALTSAIDVPFQIFHHRSKLKMTLEEMKKESKETEGDPHIKGRIRQQQREMARRRMMAAVPKADVVVTNPTHFAVALKYMEGRHRAPVVVAKGTDTVAEKIKELAREHGVPQLEAPPLARALHRHVELGDEIPAALYTAVAQVLAYVFQLKSFSAGRGAYPNAPRDIEVPEGMDPYA